MSRGQDHYLTNIVENSPVTVYTATNTAMLEYPYVLGRTGESSPTLCDQAESYILDSDIEDDSTTNEDVMERGLDLGADIVVPSDVIGDPYESLQQTVEMIDLVAESEYDPEVMLPLQQSDDFSYVDHYSMLQDKLSDRGLDVEMYPIAVGGVRDCSIEEQVRRVIQVREHVGDDVHLHALGAGMNREWIVTLRKCPWLLDSLDSSTIGQNVIYELLLNLEGEFIDYSLPRGTNSTVLATIIRQFCLYLFNYLIGPDIREEDAPTEFVSDSVASIVRDYLQCTGEWETTIEVTA